MSQKPKPCRKKAISVIGWLISVMLSGIILSAFSPLSEWVERTRDYIFCPNPLWCSSQQTFKANLGVSCEDGEVGVLIEQAIKDGDLIPPQNGSASLAKRAYLCTNDLEDQPMKKPIEHLEYLADTFPGCFEYKFSSAKGSEFLVNTGMDSDACITKINKPHRSWQNVGNYSMGRVFCFPNDGKSREGNLTNYQLLPCTRKELEKIKMPDCVLPK